ncbi:hypothetical protein OCU04_012911 [Sclerotinia nivalis]|uniref:Uncharacterized protein n=1 Tax=Sclerotinia nivalis TaxID=352851 RepID=A0A9X0DD21_9HELO|nr:hypothetical protein OCU04_012911 [Sclerotinia nivalis]
MNHLRVRVEGARDLKPIFILLQRQIIYRGGNTRYNDYSFREDKDTILLDVNAVYKRDFLCYYCFGRSPWDDGYNMKQNCPKKIEDIKVGFCYYDEYGTFMYKPKGYTNPTPIFRIKDKSEMNQIEMHTISYGFGLYRKESSIQNNKNKVPIVNVSSIEVVKGIFVNNIGYRGEPILDVNAAIQPKESARLQGRLSKKSKSIGWNEVDKFEKQIPIVPRVL